MISPIFGHLLFLESTVNSSEAIFLETFSLFYAFLLVFRRVRRLVVQELLVLKGNFKHTLAGDTKADIQRYSSINLEVIIKNKKQSME